MESIFASNAGNNFYRIYLAGLLNSKISEEMEKCLGSLSDPSIKGALITIDSTGGDINFGTIDAIRAARIKFGKPIVAYTPGNLCSMAYVIAAACDRIVASEGCAIGGIAATSYVTLGDQPITTAEEVTPEHWSVTVASGDQKNRDLEGSLSAVEETGKVMAASIIKGRPQTEASSEDWIRGGMYSTNQALENGLIDLIGTKQDAINILDNLCVNMIADPTIMTEDVMKGFTDMLAALNERLNDMSAVIQGLVKPELQSSEHDELTKLTNDLRTDLTAKIDTDSPLMGVMSGFTATQIRAISGELDKRQQQKTIVRGAFGGSKAEEESEIMKAYRNGIKSAATGGNK